MKRSPNNLVLPLLLVLLTAAVLWPIVGHEFIDYDDDVYVTANRDVQAGLTGKSVRWALTTLYNANWHPLTWLSHMLDYRLYGLKAGGHHLTSLLLHLANVVLLFLVLLRMTGSAWRSGFVAALFGIHPLHIESVAWIAERKDVLSALFWLLTMWAYARYAERPDLKRYLPILVFFALGLMAKPMLVTLPFVFLLLDYWPLGRYSGFKVQGSRFKVADEAANTQHLIPNTGSKSRISSTSTSTTAILLEKAPLFLMSAGSSAITYIAQQGGGAIAPLDRFPLGIRIANAFAAYAGYIGKMLYPRNLAVFYPHPGFHLPMWQAVGGAALLVGISVLAALGAKRRRYLVAGWLWYVITLIPVIGLIQVGSQAMADRYTYVPLIGLFIMIAWGIGGEWEKGRKEERGKGGMGETATSIFPHSHTPTPAVAGLLIILTLAASSAVQVRHWRNSYALFKHAAAVTSGNYLAHNTLGVVLKRQGRIDEAVAHYREALEIRPTYAPAHNNLGNALARQGKLAEAVWEYGEAIRIRPDYVDAHYNLGLALARQGKLPEAVERFHEVLQREPGHVRARVSLGMAFLAQGKLDDAESEYRKAIAAAPDSSDAHVKLGDVLSRRGKLDDATREFQQALRLDPRNAEAHFNTGLVLEDRGKIDEAMAKYREAVRLKPDYVEAHHNLGNLLDAVGKREEAVREYRKAIRLDPTFGPSHNNLAIALYFKGRYAEAWEEVRLARKYGISPNADFVESLSGKHNE
jgi:tetratricopeptide (TPR) repeat protein